MKQETAKSNREISSVGNRKDSVMSILVTADESFICQPNEQQIGQSVDNLGSIDGGIVVLYNHQQKIPKKSELHTSSHQLMVLVTGSQNPL
jgi:hypothetical protein